MRTVYKYPIAVADCLAIEMPAGSEILSFESQRGMMSLWVLVDTEEPAIIERRFRLAGTGHRLPEEELTYVGSAQLHGGDIVFHLFELFSDTGRYATEEQRSGNVQRHDPEPKGYRANWAFDPPEPLTAPRAINRSDVSI